MDDTERVDDEAERRRSALGFDLYVACMNKDVESVKGLLAQGASPNAYDYSSGGETREYYLRPALITAFPSVEIVRLLLKAGADANCASEWAGERGEYKTSALSIAESSASQHPEVPAYAEIAELLRQYSGRREDVSPTDGMRLKFLPEGWAYWEKVDDGPDQSD